MLILIIDDEYRARKGLAEQIEQLFPRTFSISQASSVGQGVKLIEEQTPSIVMLDIQMEDGSGFDLLKSVTTKDFELIFTTAYKDYALEAFDHDAASYLLKPISPQKLTASLKKAMKNYHRAQSIKRLNIIGSGLLTNKNKRMKIPVTNGLRFVDGEEVNYVKAEGNYFKIFFKEEQPLLVSKTLRFFEDQMDSNLFMRVHKSYIVNLKKVVGYSRSDGGTLIMPSNYEIPVSAKYKGAFLERVSIKV